MAVSKPLHPLNLKLGVVEAFYEALSAVNDKELKLTAADITYSDIKPDSSLEGANTSVLLTPVANSKQVMGDPLVRHYTRWDMTELLSMYGFTDNQQKLRVSEDLASLDDDILHAMALSGLNLVLDSNIGKEWTTWTRGAVTADAIKGTLAIVAGCPTLLGTVEFTVVKETV